jgi:hypothetical protein
MLVAGLMLVTLVSPARAAPTRRPGPPPPDLAQRIAKMDRHQKVGRISTATRGALSDSQEDGSGRIRTISNWKGSFTTDGVVYPFTMAGKNPRRGDETRIDSSLIVLSFLFDEFVDANGNNIVIDSSDIVDDFLGSPNFVKTRYANGVAQFSDSLQRASFFRVMQPDWHTTVDRPRMLTPVTIEVPPGLGQVFQVGDTLVAQVDDAFFGSQLNTIFQLEDVRPEEVPMLLSHNVFTVFALGFHGAFEVTTRNGRPGVQTFLWTSWLDESLFGPIFADATTLTHEVSEWMADPFVDNIVPLYSIPDSGNPPFCSNLLEVGDAIEFLPNQMTPVTVHGKLYHTQVEATLQWFSRESPSSAFMGAYSWPDITVQTTFGPPCPP